MSDKNTLINIPFLQRIMRCKSITPKDDGAIDIIADELESYGFQCKIMTFDEEVSNKIPHSPVKNLYASYGSPQAKRNICFLGHSDVVPTGPLESWKYSPFAAEITDGIIYGRGAVDMKGAICSFISAIPSIKEMLKEEVNREEVSISLLITGDEEGIAVNGTKKILKWLKEENKRIDFCIVGEPVSKKKIGDTIKVGARGSATFCLTTYGTQGHVAYKGCYINAAEELISVMQALCLEEWSIGSNSSLMPSTNLEITKIHSDSGAENVVPKEAKAYFNIRYNESYTAASLYEYTHNLIKQKFSKTKFSLTYHSSGDAFSSVRSKELHNAAISGVSSVCGYKPEFNCDGGTSDARFIKDICPFIELGLLGGAAHQVNEHAKIEEIGTLAKIYQQILLSLAQG